MNGKQLIPAVLAGVLAGAALAGPASAAVVSLTATPSTQTFYVDGARADLEAYVIGGHNYVQLRDIGRALDIGVGYDPVTNSAWVDSGSRYTEDAAVPSGTVTIPRTGEPLYMEEGDQVLCDDGTVYEITDLRLWQEPEPLPQPAAGLAGFPALELPEAEARRYTDRYGDDLFIRNLYEIRRMAYTLYNAAASCPELRRDGTPALDLHLGITEQSSVQPFWPWQEDQLTQVFWSAPGARFQVDAWDVYHDGKYLYTEYDIRGT